MSSESRKPEEPARSASDPKAEPMAEPGGRGARKPFALRLPTALHAELRGWANQELRSLNAHIEYLLRDAIRRRRGDGG